MNEINKSQGEELLLTEIFNLPTLERDNIDIKSVNDLSTIKISSLSEVLNDTNCLEKIERDPLITKTIKNIKAIETEEKVEKILNAFLHTLNVYTSSKNPIPIDKMYAAFELTLEEKYNELYAPKKIGIKYKFAELLKSNDLPDKDLSKKDLGTVKLLREEFNYLYKAKSSNLVINKPYMIISSISRIVDIMIDNIKMDKEVKVDMKKALQELGNTCSIRRKQCKKEKQINNKPLKSNRSRNKNDTDSFMR